MTINEKIKYTIGFIILTITLYFISTKNELRPTKIPCMKNPTVLSYDGTATTSIISRQFLYKGELYIKMPNKIGIKNLYCKDQLS